ncbi:hypothetical protein MWU65_03695 [Cellulophaga sp. F20128]|uniref:hypothetical protein n=1 Tax=Cellulophaga sp. F20128 TaxID=2926413 RepID=UPI001FF2AF52|nr:hypothetical protein [Cellulophaga sp. F20128]MCK0156267.1 hypothetical protein [Cellulophaga sp. F20128]
MKNFSVLCFAFLLIMGCSKDSSDQDSIKTNTAANLKASGDSANDILSNVNYDALTFEIAYVKNYKPSTESIANFISFIKATTFKDNISVVYKELSSPNETTLSLKKIASLETENRTQYTKGKTLSIYIYFADAPSENDEEDTNAVTLGAVYRNTSMIIYEATIKKLTAKSFLITEAAVEEATLNHEMGHLMGLVNLGSEMVNNHEEQTTDEEGNEVGNSHCTTLNCLMSTELEFGGGMKKMLVASKNSAPTLDAECIADLKANGGR